MIKEILYEIINEASKGNIIIDNDSFPIGFNTIILNDIQKKEKNENFPTLLIKDKNEFINSLTKYVEIALKKYQKFPTFIENPYKNKIKLIISYLFANATTEDFLNSINLINRNIEFLNDDTFNFLNESIDIELNNAFENSNIRITNEKQSIFMETPNKITFSLKNNLNNETLNYDLPSISYGIIDNNGKKECYIYGIINPKENKNSSETQIKYSKKIKRELYKLNDGIFNIESKEYQDYKQNIDNYYPENISDVSPSAILSISLFISLLEKENIKIIKIIPYLPIRYLSREIIAEETKNHEINERNDKIQANITDKFIRTFRRIQYHLKGLNIDYYPYEYNEYMQLSFEEIDHNINNLLLNETYNSSLNTFNLSQKNK